MALELDPSLAAAHFALASIGFRRARYEEALVAVEAGLGLEPEHVQGRRLRFALHDALGDLEAASAALEAYIEVDAAGAAELLQERAQRSFEAGELERARAQLERLVVLEPDRARAHHGLGLVYASSDARLARKHLRRFLELAPRDPEAVTAKRLLEALE